MNKYLEKFKNLNPLHHRKILVYLIFISISTVIWFLVTLSNNFVTNVSYPVRFSNLPENKALVNELPEYLNLKVEAHGFTLLRYKINQTIIPVNINLKKNNIFQAPGSKSKYFLLTRYAQSNIISQVSDELKVLDIQPDSIIFDFSPIVNKRVAVIPNTEYELGKQYILKKNVYTIPDSITITGPGSMLDTINFVETKSHNFKTLESSINRNVSIVGIDNIEFSEKRVNVVIDIEKYTQGTFSIPISVVNIPENTIITTLPDKVNVTFNAALSDFHKVDETQFKAVANYNSISGLNNDKLRVELKRYPSFIRSVKTNPSHVSFFLEKR